MKVLEVFHGNDFNNGVDRTALTLATTLRTRGVEIHALVAQEGVVTAELDRLGIQWTAAPLGCCTSFAWRARARYLGLAQQRYRMLTELFARKEFDLVHIHTGHPCDAALAATEAGIPAIWHIHAPFAVDYQRYRDFLSPRAYAWMLNELGSQIIGVSEDTRTSLLEWSPAERVHAVYNGVDVEELRSRATQGADLRRELNAPADAQVVLGVGRISEQKDFATFVRVAENVAREHHRAYFAIVGPAEDRELARALARQIEAAGLQSRILLLGARPDVPRLLAQADVFLSTAKYEGHPLTSLEAMALERPVVAMACEGLRQCLEDGVSGLLTPLGDVAACGAAVSKVLGDPSAARKIAAAGHDHVKQHFSNINYAQQFLAVANLAIARGAPPWTAAAEIFRDALREIRTGVAYMEKLEREAERGLVSRARSAARKLLTSS